MFFKIKFCGNSIENVMENIGIVCAQGIGVYWCLSCNLSEFLHKKVIINIPSNATNVTNVTVNWLNLRTLYGVELCFIVLLHFYELRYDFLLDIHNLFILIEFSVYWECMHTQFHLFSVLENLCWLHLVNRINFIIRK